MTDGNGKPKEDEKPLKTKKPAELPDKDPKWQKKKEGWKNASKSLKCVIVLQPDFQGVMFALDNVPLRKIGVEVSKIVLQGKPMQNVMNVSHPQAPPYRIIITNDKLELYIKGMPPILIQ